MSGGEKSPMSLGFCRETFPCLAGWEEGGIGEAGGGDFLQPRSGPPDPPPPSAIGMGGAPGPSPPSSHHGDLGDAGSRRRFRSPGRVRVLTLRRGARAPRDVGVQREGPPGGGGWLRRLISARRVAGREQTARAASNRSGRAAHSSLLLGGRLLPSSSRPHCVYGGDTRARAASFSRSLGSGSHFPRPPRSRDPSSLRA